MARRHYNLPALTTLGAFEAAARHLSFKAAAAELGVTPGAVSHQIRTLEADLGAPLFRRKHRGVELTDGGARLFNTLASAFGQLSQDLRQIRADAQTDQVTLGSSSAVAMLWLSACVLRFWRKYPAVNVNQIAQDWPFAADAPIDLYIRYGRAPDPAAQQTELYRDDLVPVTAPGLAASLDAVDLATLAGQRLIHLESEYKSWTSWPDWFAQQGYTGPVASGITVNNYAVALQVAQDGAGVALGWRRLISPVIGSGDLTVIDGHLITAPNAFYLVSKPEQDLSKNALLLRKWILDEVN